MGTVEKLQQVLDEAVDSGEECGCEAFADKVTGFAVGFTKNKVNGNHPNHITRNKISRLLGIPERIW